MDKIFILDQKEHDDSEISHRLFYEVDEELRKSSTDIPLCLLLNSVIIEKRKDSEVLETYRIPKEAFDIAIKTFSDLKNKEYDYLKTKNNN